MKTTETDVIKQLLPATFPLLHLLFSGDTGVLEVPARALRIGATLLGREVSEAEGISVPTDGRASRLHACIHCAATGDAPQVIDQQSKNGLFVNGLRVHEAVLGDGDVIRIGNSFFLLRYELPLSEDTAIDALWGRAPAMRAARSALARAAKSAATLLLLGESGAGKEVAAKAVHELSRRGGRFVPVNCSAIPESLAESQLFGHTARAFTGAGAHEGFFRAASSGTLFLDEVGELTLAMQPKLLRALEDRAITSVGSTQSLPCDARVVAATNRDLSQAVAEGGFRGDLYARLTELVIQLPPLRERREDILPLLLRFIGPPVPQLTPALVEALLLHSWPFNVRELAKTASHLQNVAQPGMPLDVALVADRLAQAARTQRPAQPKAGAAMEAPLREPLHESDEEIESNPRQPPPSDDELRMLLEKYQGNISQVARVTGRSRRQVDRWLVQFGIARKPSHS